MEKAEKLSEKLQETLFEKLLSREENATCADCNAKGPRWVSLSFGVFICMRCAGPHRGLGPLYTKVRSVKLDTWTIEMAEIMEKIGNKVANEFWEYKMPVSFRKPTVSSTQQELERFVQEKYVKRSFAPEDFLDPVAEFLENKRGNPSKTLSKAQENADNPAKATRKSEEKPQIPDNRAKTAQITTKVAPNSSKNTLNLWEDAPDLMEPSKNEEFTEFIEANNPPLTPKVSISASIMEMYKAPVEKKPEKNATSFPINHQFLNNSTNFATFPGNFAGFPGNHGNFAGFPGNFQGNPGNHGNFAGFPGNHANFQGNHGSFAGFQGNSAKNSEKHKVSGDIMGLYGKKSEISLSGAEMQMQNAKKGVGQENYMGLYNGQNFNVW